jgi:hypothetical protein
MGSFGALMGTTVPVLSSYQVLLGLHVAERGPDPQHNFPGEVAPGQVRTYQVHHTHYHANESSDLAFNDPVSDRHFGADSMLYLITFQITFQDGTGPDVTSMGTAVIPRETVFPDPDDHRSLSIVSHAGVILTKALVRPADQPAGTWVRSHCSRLECSDPSVQTRVFRLECSGPSVQARTVRCLTPKVTGLTQGADNPHAARWRCNKPNHQTFDTSTRK